MGTLTQSPPRERDRHGHFIASRTIDERFFEKVDAFGDCWEWLSGKDGQGYGLFTVSAKKSRRSHLVCWELLVGPIPPRHELDHLCRNTSCCNPDHLEPVTKAEHGRRGHGPIARQRYLTHCKHGHAFSPKNTRRASNGKRECLTCRKEISRRSYERRKATGKV